MTAVRSVSIVGAGVAGLAAAISFAERGIEATVYEAKPDIGALGSGITLQGNALRELDRLGVWEQVRDAGYPFDLLSMRAPGPDATVLAEVPDVKMGCLLYTSRCV